jgi:UDP-N-acetylmuramoyl-tripeptide--D-alanyl-D-alanine ligase
MERRGITIWNDCYNSNPEAARAMLDVLRATPARRRFAVLGEMLELGQSTEALHREVGRYAAERGIDVLIAIRGAARFMVEEAVRAGLSESAAYFFEDPAVAGDFVRGILREGDAVLFKGSRGVQVERALERVSGDGG